jgi:hypothetical protein
MERRARSGRLVAAMLPAASLGASGCVFVPAPVPVLGPPVLVAPRPVVVIPGRPVYRAYHPYRDYRPYPYYHRGYGGMR